MGTVASQITSLSFFCSTACSGADQKNIWSSASLAFVRGIRRWPVNSSHKGPVTRKMFPFDDVIMNDSYCWLLYDESTKRPFQYQVRHLFERSREISTVHNWGLELLERSEMWQISRQHCHHGTCQIPKKSKHHKETPYRILKLPPSGNHVTPHRGPILWKCVSWEFTSCSNPEVGVASVAWDMQTRVPASHTQWHNALGLESHCSPFHSHMDRYSGKSSNGQFLISMERQIGL